MASFPETYNDPNARRICSQSHLHSLSHPRTSGDWGIEEMERIVFANYYIMIPVSIGNSMI